MKRLILGWLFAIFSVSFAFAACPAGTYFTTNGNNCIFVSPTNPLPMGMGFTQTARAPDLTATNTTGSVALGASAYVARVCNTSATISAYVALGDSSVTVTTANGILVPAGQCANLNIGTATYLAGITSSSTAVLQTSIGSGLASLGGGGSGSGGGTGTVTSVSVTTQNGVSATVTNPTTTPALAFTLGAITPSSAAIGAGSAITSSGPGGALTALGYTTPGTGVATALGVNVGTAGAFVVNGGALGTPSSGTATNLSGTASGLTAGNVTTNANLTGVITSSGNTTSIASQTGTGTKFVVDTSPTLVTPELGNASFTALTGTGLGKFGEAEIGTWPFAAGFAMFGSKSLDQTVAGNFAVLQQNDGATFVNAATGKNVNFQINSSTIATLNSAGLAIGGSAITNTGPGGALVASAYTDTTNASNITSGTLGAAEMGNAGTVRAKLLGANLNTTADQAITLTLPAGSTNYIFVPQVQVRVSNPSVSMTTAVCGMWSGAGKTGTTIIGSGANGVAMSGLTATAANTSGNSITPTVNGTSTTYYNFTTLYFACSTAQGAPATADVTVTVQVLN